LPHKNESDGSRRTAGEKWETSQNYAPITEAHADAVYEVFDAWAALILAEARLASPASTGKSGPGRPPGRRKAPKRR
jgi:hypothetical protein